MRHPRIATVAIVALTVYATASGLLARNPFPDTVPIYAAIVDELPAGEIQFRSGRPDREGLFSHHALLLAAAPRRIERVHGVPTAEWVVTDQLGHVEGFRRVREWSHGIALHQRAQ